MVPRGRAIMPRHIPGNPLIDPDVTLAYRFTDGTLAPFVGAAALTFTRSTTGLYYDALGVEQTAAINEPRFNHDPISGAALGLLIEPARTNLFLNSAAPVTQDVTTAANTYAIQVWGAGSITVSGSAAGVATEGAPLIVTALAGTMSCTVAGVLSRAQVELGAGPSSYIATAGAPVARGADYCETLDMTWFNPVEGTVYESGLFPALNNGGVMHQIDSGGATNRYRETIHSFNQARGTYIVTVGSVNQANIVFTSNTWNPGVLGKSAMCYKLNDFEYYHNGLRAGTGIQVGVLSPAMTRLTLGTSGTGPTVETITGNIAAWAYANVRKSNEYLADITAPV